MATRGWELTVIHEMPSRFLFLAIPNALDPLAAILAAILTFSPPSLVAIQ